VNRRLQIGALLGAVFAIGACSLFTDLSSFNDAPAPDASADGATSPDAPDAPGANDTGIDTGLEAGIDACADADISIDPSNCGACNRSCLGGSCAFGKCGAVEIVGNLPLGAGIAIAKGALYVSLPGTIRRYDLDGKNGIDVASSTAPGYLTADDNYLYWIDVSEKKVKRWSLVNGGGAEDLVPITGPLSPSGIAVSPDHVYWTLYTTDGGVERALLDGGSYETVFGPYNHPEDIEFANGALIVGGDGVNELAVFEDAGFGPKRVLSMGNAPETMVYDDGFVYWAEQATGKIMRIPFAGGGKEELASGGHIPTGIALTTTAVYWRNWTDGGIMRVAR